jgi:plasmid stability protein
MVLTIRDVPENVRDALAQQAREHGQSLQALLLGILERQAAYTRNKRLLTEIELDLAAHGGAGDKAPDADDVLADARSEREQSGPATADDSNGAA